METSGRQGRQITKIAREVGKFTLRTLRREGIGASEFDVIHAVRKNPGCTQAEVCRITGLDKGAVARVTASLERKGYLRREENPRDRRERHLTPTEAAQSLKNSKAALEGMFYEWLLAALPPDERETFVRLLDILYRRCKEESKAGFPHVLALLERAALSPQPASSENSPAPPTPSSFDHPETTAPPAPVNHDITAVSPAISPTSASSSIKSRENAAPPALANHDAPPSSSAGFPNSAPSSHHKAAAPAPPAPADTAVGAASSLTDHEQA